MIYLAQYTVNAYEESFSGARSYEKKDELNFEADDDETARQIANEARYKTVGAHLIGATVSLDKLLKVEEVKL